MPRHQFRRDVCPSQFAPHKRAPGILPNRVLHVYDRRHQRNETQVALDHRQQRADPATVTGAENSEFVAAHLAQRGDELAHFDHALTKTFGVTNQVRGDREFAIPMTTWYARVVIGQMKKAGVPTELVEVSGPTPVTDVGCRHERVQHDYRWRAFTSW